MFRRRSDADERTSGRWPCQGAPVSDRVHLAQSRGASPDHRIKQITLNRARTLRRAFSCTSECCIAHDARARQHSPAHSPPVEFSRIRTLISVGFVITRSRRFPPHPDCSRVLIPVLRLYCGLPVVCFLIPSEYFFCFFLDLPIDKKENLIIIISNGNVPVNQKQEIGTGYYGKEKKSYAC